MMMDITNEDNRKYSKEDTCTVSKEDTCKVSKENTCIENSKKAELYRDYICKGDLQAVTKQTENDKTDDMVDDHGMLSDYASSGFLSVETPSDSTTVEETNESDTNTELKFLKMKYNQLRSQVFTLNNQILSQKSNLRKETNRIKNEKNREINKMDKEMRYLNKENGELETEIKEMKQLNEHQAEENLAYQGQIIEYQSKIKELQNTIEILENKCQTTRVCPDIAVDIRSQASELKHARKEIEELKRRVDQMAVQLKKKDETLRKKDDAIRRKDDTIRRKDDIIRRHDEATKGLRKDMNKQFDVMNKHVSAILMFMTEDRESVQKQLTQIKESMPSPGFKGPKSFNNKKLLTSSLVVNESSSKTTVLPEKLLPEARGRLFMQTKVAKERATSLKKQPSLPSKRRESTM